MWNSRTQHLVMSKDQHPDSRAGVACTCGTVRPRSRTPCAMWHEIHWSVPYHMHFNIRHASSLPEGLIRCLREPGILHLPGARQLVLTAPDISKWRAV